MMAKMQSTRSGLLFEDTSRYDLWLKLIMVGVPALMFVGGMALVFEDMAGALTMFGSAAFIILIFKAIMPTRFQIFEDRLRVVLGGPFSFSIPFSNVKRVRAASGAKALGLNTAGVHFATSFKYVVEISRKRGPAVTISPARGELFLEQLERAIEMAAGQGQT